MPPACAVLLLLLFAGLAAADSPQPNLSLRISDETAPAGSWTQVKVFLAAPSQVTQGSLLMDFDPLVFGDIANVEIFSATGDASGYAHVKGKHVDAHFSSPSGGIGQLPGLPVFVVSIPVLAGLPKGQTATLTIDTTKSQLQDTAGRPYSISVTPATFQVGGSMSIQTVAPAGGVLPAGTVVKISGTGFESSTAVAIDGVAIASTQLVSSEQVNVTLGAATQMDGEHMRLTNSSGEVTDFFSALPSTPSDQQPYVQPLLPLTTYKTVQWDFPFAHPEIYQYFALQNQTLAPVTVTFFNNFLGISGTTTIPAGGLIFPYYFSLPGAQSGLGSILYMTASAPIRMLAYELAYEGPYTYEGTFPPRLFSGWFFQPFEQQSNDQTATVTWNWQIGTTAPATQQVNYQLNQDTGPIHFTVSVPTSTSQWLSVTPTQGTTPAILTFTPNVSSLSPGTYTTTVTVTAILPALLSEVPAPVYTIQVTLNVSPSPFIMLSGNPPPTRLGFTTVIGQTPPPPTVLSVVDWTTPTTYKSTVSTSSGGAWLSVAPADGATPGTLTVTANSAGLAVGQYSGQLVIQGSANTLVLPVVLGIYSATYTSSASFIVAGGASYPPGLSQTVETGPVLTFSVQTQSGGNWLAAVVDTGDINGGLRVTASPAGLGLGIYSGTITGINVKNPFSILVTLALLGPPAVALTVTPSSLSFTAPAGQIVTQSLAVNSASGPALFSLTNTSYPASLASVSVTLTNAAVSSTPSPMPVAPATLQVQAGASQPGTYYASIVITWDGGSLTVPITLSVTATAASPPIMANVVNGASFNPAALAPGELISIFGMGIGAAPSGFTLDAKGNLPTTIGGTQVLVNGDPAPLLYASTSQINAIIPYEVGTSGTPTIQVVSNGLSSAAWGVPVAPAAPGLFTIGSAGVGQAAVLNQDNSVNSPANPAARGTAIQIFATGGGQTTPASVTGSLAGGPDATALPVTVTVGGVDAPVFYHGSAPGEVAGVLQINAVVPPGATPGPAAPVFATVGGNQSQGGVTIAVQ